MCCCEWRVRRVGCRSLGLPVTAFITGVPAGHWQFGPYCYWLRGTIYGPTHTNAGSELRSTHMRTDRRRCPGQSDRLQAIGFSQSREPRVHSHSSHTICSESSLPVCNAKFYPCCFKNQPFQPLDISILVVWILLIINPYKVVTPQSNSI